MAECLPGDALQGAHLTCSDPGKPTNKPRSGSDETPSRKHLAVAVVRVLVVTSRMRGFSMRRWRISRGGIISYSAAPTTPAAETSADPTGSFQIPDSHSPPAAAVQLPYPIHNLSSTSFILSSPKRLHQDPLQHIVPLKHLDIIQRLGARHDLQPWYTHHWTRTRRHAP